MSDSIENANELDSYGVWVKNSSTDETPSIDETQLSDSQDFTSSLDLPSFDEFNDTDNSNVDNIFSDDFNFSSDSEASPDSLILDNDTTLNSDELLNITNNADIVESDINIDDDFTIEEPTPSIEEPLITESTELTDSIDDSFLTDTSLDNIQDSSLDDFGFEEGTHTLEVTEYKEETIQDNNEDSLDLSELNIDDNSLEEPMISEPMISEPISNESTDSTDNEEISLDDFMDEGFSDESVASGNNGYEVKEEPTNASSDEVSLDDFLDGGFEGDKSNEQEEQVEDNPLDMSLSFDDSADSIITEDNVSVTSDFDDDDFDSTSEDTISDSSLQFDTDNNLDFDKSQDNIDAEEVSLEDFGIDSNAEETPVTQDIAASKVKEQIVDYDLSVDNDSTATAPIVNEIRSSDTPKEETGTTTAINNSLLEQIVNDLSSLKNEINTLKVNLDEIKTKDNSYSLDDEFEIKEEKDEGGFFSKDDTDDTIALSTDELTNIINTTTLVASEEDNLTEETNEDSLNVSEPEENTDTDETIVDSFDENIEVVNEDPFEIRETAISDGDLELNDELSLDFANENLEEPEIDSEKIMEVASEIDTEIEDEDLPQEIEIQKDDLIVESSTSDFMDSITDSSEPTITEQSLSDEEVAENYETKDVETFTDVFDSDSEDETIQNSIDELKFSTVEDNFEESENKEKDLDNLFVTEETKPELTESNIDYLTSDNSNIPQDSLEDNSELKKDIKSVLLYMDQLLENLPEDKIVEFAKSDEFTTYKKLFSELGLS